MTRNRLLLAAAVAASGCQSYEGDVEDLTGYTVRAWANDETYGEHDRNLRHVSFAFDRDLPSHERAGCASVRGATIRFNGRGISTTMPGGWGPTMDFYKNGDECSMPFISAPRPVPAQLEDAMLEISDGRAPFVVAVPLLYGERQMSLQSMSGSEILLRLEPPLEGKVWAQMRSTRWSTDYQSLRGTLLAGIVRLEIPPGTRGPRFIKVDVSAEAPVGACERFQTCKASITVTRQLTLDIP